MARNVGAYYSDIGGAGDESVPLTIAINETCPLAELQWGGSVESPGSVYTYLVVCNRPFSLDVVAQAALAGEILVKEFTVRQKDHLFGLANGVTIGDPLLTKRLIDIHTVEALPVYMGLPRRS